MTVSRLCTIIGCLVLVVATSSASASSASLVPRHETCGDYGYFSNISVGSYDISHWGETEVDGSPCDARVEIWIVGAPYGAEIGQNAGYASAEAEWHTNDQFCGLFTGRSNHWMIDSGGWHELITWLTDQEYAPWCD